MNYEEIRYKRVTVDTKEGQVRERFTKGLKGSKRVKGKEKRSDRERGWMDELWVRFD